MDIFAKFPAGLRRLHIRNRNRVRAILAETQDADALNLLNKLRQRIPWQDLLQIERVLRQVQFGIRIPVLFPREAQTTDGFTRLVTIGLPAQLNILNALIAEHQTKLADFCDALRALNSAILLRDVQTASQMLGDIRICFGYSHLLLRKAALIKALAENAQCPAVDAFLEECGSEKNSIICTSLQHCYQEDPDYLTLKRSILSVAPRGSSNKFSRDISRISFHPHAKNEVDFSSLLQSAFQSSLIDACLLAKINREAAGQPLELGSETLHLFSQFEAASPSLEEIAKLYARNTDAAEELFFKRSSAWFELDEMIDARFALDHFNDAPEAAYLQITPQVSTRAKRWLKELTAEQLVGQRLTTHIHPTLAAIENEGTYSRSAAFNFNLWQTEGFFEISEEVCFDLMGLTQDLSKTSSPKYLRNLANANRSEMIKLVIYLLVAKRSRNEKDDHRLRHIIQNIAIRDYGSSLVQLIAAIGDRTMTVAEYAYEVFTEDFIAKLSRITKSAAQITETRAKLHQWMGEKTNRKVYIDRARTILIDHQINRVRNEIDDNRIYVDAARFNEWVNDELVVELNALFGAFQKNLQKGTIDATQLVGLISRCYSMFCQNQVFGVASYLGRRIRHGTFKGHLYYSTVGALESRQDFAAIKNDPGFLPKWETWKKQFESNIDVIIRERLHIESPTKKLGFLRTGIETPDKYDIALACAKNIIGEYLESNSAVSAATLLSDYCWRLAEVDLKAFNGWLKGQKNSLINIGLLDELKSLVPIYHRTQVSSLHRETLRAIQDKLNGMSAWFKRPPSVSPKASLSLLFRAVVAEVQESYPQFKPAVDDSGGEIELFGGAYHVLYDSFYVAVFNAAKHGKCNGHVDRYFSIEGHSITGYTVVCEIASELRDEDSEIDVEARLTVAPHELADIDNAQIFEGRSGMRKLHQLTMADDRFSIRHIKVKDRKVSLAFAYALR